MARGIRKLGEECDCDLSLDPHPMNRDHYRACKAPHGADPDITCQVIRGHRGPHKAQVIQWAEWTGDVADPIGGGHD